MTAECCHPTIDTLLDGRVKIVQPSDGYRVAIDSVLLAAAAPARPGDTVLDVGAGTGAISFCLLSRVPDLSVTALECDPAHLDLLRRGVELNEWCDRIDVVDGDITRLPQQLRARQFDHVVTNPPYYEAGSNRRPLQPSRSAAGHEAVPLNDWLLACARRVRSGGSLSLIHRVERLDAILTVLGQQFGGITIKPLWPNAKSSCATRVIIVARSGSRAPARLERGLTLHQADGRYTSIVQRLLRDADALAALSDDLQ